MGITVDPDGLDPHRTAAAATFQVTNSVYDPLLKVTTSGETIKYELPDSFVDDGSETAKAVLLAKDSLDAAGGTQDRQESREALRKALEEYYRAHGQIAND